MGSLCKFYKNHLIEEFSIKPSEILVINNEVSIKKIDHNPIKITEANDIKFVLPGRFYFPQKGQDILINSVKMLSSYKLNAKFLFIGDGPDKDNLYNLAKNEIEITSTKYNADDYTFNPPFS